MKKIPAVLLCLLVAVPTSSAGQIVVVFRTGTLGVFGMEGVVGVADRIEVRGGFGIWTLEAETDVDDVPVTVSFPDLTLNLGMDYYLNDSFRVGGGYLHRNDYPQLIGSFTDVVDIGGTPLTPTEVGTLRGTVTSNKNAAYAMIGFGRPTGSGWGLSVDFGAVYLGSPEVTLWAEGGTYPQDELDELLALETVDFQNDMKTYFRIWPILNLSFRKTVG